MAVKKMHEPKRPVATKDRPRTVFLSAPVGLETRPIRQAFEKKGVRTFSPDQLDMPGQRFTDVIQEAINRADLVVAVVDSSAASNFVFFEMGYAVKMGKPTAVLIADDATNPFWVSSGIPYFRFNPEHPTGLDFVAQQILSLPHHGSKSTAGVKETHPIGAKATELLERLANAGNDINEHELLEIIGLALRETGVASISGHGKDQYPDFAVWSDDFFPWVGNPVAIELKRELVPNMSTAFAIRHLHEAMTKAGFVFGILVYLNGSADFETSIPFPNVAAISIKDLLESLRTTSLGNFVRQIRNKRVHGVP
jgi:TIR domain